MAERRSTRGLAAAAGLSVALALVGCASVPTSGKVHLGSLVPGTGGLNQVDIRVLPSGPSPGMSRSDVVSQFLRAQVDADGGFAIARTYLAPGTVWHPGSSQTTYDESTQAVTASATTKVTVTARRTGVIDGDGYYLADPGRLRRTFTLVKVEGQWRISGLPDGVLLATADAARTKQLATLYYPDAAGTHLVPQEVLLPVASPGLATTLVDDVVGGARSPLSTAVRTVFPAGSQVLGNVPIDGNGVAEIDLPATARTLSPEDLRAVSAALVWTLRQLTEVTAIRLLAGGTLLTGAAVPALQPISSWADFAPEQADPAGGVLLSDGRVRGIGVSVPSGLRGLRARAPVIGDGGTIVAALAVSSGGASLLTGATAGAPRSRITGPQLTAPVIDQAGDVLVGVREGQGTEIAAVATSGRVSRVAVPASLLRGRIDQLALDPTGSRIALVVGSAGHRSLRIGVLGRTAAGLEVSGLATVISAAGDVGAVSWSGGGQLVALRHSASGRQELVECDPSGYRVRRLAVGPLPGVVSTLAAASGKPILLGVGSRVYRSVDQSWQPLARGTDPSYTG